MFQKIVAPSIRELFIRQIQEMILSGELLPGDRLPTERELADEMNVSKTVVHEGLRELCRMGFLDVASRQGVTVADYAQIGNVETLLAIMRYRGGHLDPKTAESLLAVRLYIEGPALRKLAESHTEEDVALLRSLRDAAAACAEDREAMADAFFRYHRTVAFLSGNALTPLIFNAFSPISRVVWVNYLRIFGTDACLRQLDAFTDAIEQGDGERAYGMLWEGLVEYAAWAGVPFAERRTETMDN